MDLPPPSPPTTIPVATPPLRERIYVIILWNFVSLCRCPMELDSVAYP